MLDYSIIGYIGYDVPAGHRNISGSISLNILLDILFAWKCRCGEKKLTDILKNIVICSYWVFKDSVLRNIGAISPNFSWRSLSFLTVKRASYCINMYLM